MNRIYFDHAATTPIDPEVFRVMEAFLCEDFGNPSSPHSWGRDARSALDRARQDIAETLGAEAKEIVFTSGGTEGANLVLQGVAGALRSKGNHLVISSIEHPCVTECAAFMEKQGFLVTPVPVDDRGFVDPGQVAKVLRPQTVLVSVLAASHEVGSLQPLREIARIVHAAGALFHTDAVQAYGRVSLGAADGFDYLTASSHKFYGPKGAGFLYQRKDAPLMPLLHGGSQERGRRAGTENVPAIVGMAEAALRAAACREREARRLEGLVAILLEGLRRRLPDLVVNGPGEGRSDADRRLPGFVNLGVPGIEGENLVQALDTKGFAVSTGPACSAGAGGASRTLSAMGRDRKSAREGFRISLGRSNTEAQVRQLVEVMPLVVERLRMLSPLLEE